MSVSSVKRFTATTTGTPNLRAMPMWAARFTKPFSSDSRFSARSSGGRGLPAMTLPRPPCILRARMVATMTTQSGTRPLVRHLMSMNFSIPMSAPKPDSVTT